MNRCSFFEKNKACFEFVLERILLSMKNQLDKSQRDYIKQVELLDFPTFKVQRELSKCGYFKRNDMKTICDPEDPANPNKSLFQFENKYLKVTANKRIQYTIAEDKVLILLLHTFLKKNGNPSKKKSNVNVERKIPLQTFKFIELTVEDYEGYLEDGQIDKIKIQNERKKIKSIISNLTSIISIECNGKKLKLFENEWIRDNMFDQFIVVFSEDLTSFLLKQSKEISINYRPASLFSLGKLSYLIGSYFSQIIYMRCNIQQGRNKLTIRAILTYLDCVLPSEKEIKNQHGSFAGNIMQPVMQCFDELEDANIFAVAKSYSYDVESCSSKSNCINWMNAFVSITPLDTVDEYNYRLNNVCTKKSQKELIYDLKTQVEYFSNKKNVRQSDVDTFFSDLSSLLNIDCLTIRSVVTNIGDIVNKNGKTIKQQGNTIKEIGKNNIKSFI